MAGHDTYIKGSQRFDLCLSHQDPHVVVLTEFEMRDGRWTQTKDAVNWLPKSTVEEAQQLMTDIAKVLLAADFSPRCAFCESGCRCDPSTDARCGHWGCWGAGRMDAPPDLYNSCPGVAAARARHDHLYGDPLPVTAWLFTKATI